VRYLVFAFDNDSKGGAQDLVSTTDDLPLAKKTSYDKTHEGGYVSSHVLDTETLTIVYLGHSHTDLNEQVIKGEQNEN